VERYQDAEHRLQFYDRVLRSLGDRAALSTGLPPYGLPIATLHITGVDVSGSRYVGQQSVSPRYFQVMGERLLRGREFIGRDRASLEPVAIVNETLAAHYFPNADPIARRIAWKDPWERNPGRGMVGVVAEEKGAGGFDQVGGAEMPMVLRPLAQDPPRSVSIIARVSGAGLRRAAAEID